MYNILKYINFEDDVIRYNNGLFLAYMTKTEVLKLKSALDDTIEFYESNDVTDVDINSFNDSQRNKSFESVYSKTSKPNKKVKRSGYIYLAKNTKTNNLKIGFSKNPKNRVSQLNLSSDVKIVYLGSFEGFIDDEKILHKKYKSLNLNSEWFKFSDEILKEFKL